MNVRRHFLFCTAAGFLLSGLYAPVGHAQSATNVIASQPVSAPPKPFTGALPANVLVWDSELKSIDIHVGDTAGHLAYNFTNVSSDNVVILNVHPGCGCTTAQLPPLPWTVAAGESGHIGVDINLQGKTSQPGMLPKNLTVTTDKGVKTLIFRVNVLAAVQPELSAAERASDLATAKVDRQAVFKGECYNCHAKQSEGRYGKPLYDAACGICHEGDHRSPLVPDLHNLTAPTSVEFWRTWIAHGKPGTLMPAFANSDGGPLNEMQIANLAQYLNFVIQPKRIPAGAIQ